MRPFRLEDHHTVPAGIDIEPVDIGNANTDSAQTAGPVLWKVVQEANGKRARCTQRTTSCNAPWGSGTIETGITEAYSRPLHLLCITCIVLVGGRPATVGGPSSNGNVRVAPTPVGSILMLYQELNLTAASRLVFGHMNVFAPQALGSRKEVRTMFLRDISKY